MDLECGPPSLMRTIGNKQIEFKIYANLMNDDYVVRYGLNFLTFILQLRENQKITQPGQEFETGPLDQRKRRYSSTTEVVHTINLILSKMK